jgi:hypothetical protein
MEPGGGSFRERDLKASSLTCFPLLQIAKPRQSGHKAPPIHTSPNLLARSCSHSDIHTHGTEATLMIQTTP